MIILGVDPGTAITGYGILKIQNPKSKIQNRLTCLGYGSIRTNPAAPMAERLKKIHDELNKLINKHKPSILAVENIYFFKNLKTALPVSQAKGVILLAAAQKNIPAREFTPLQVKMAVSGYGRAEKKQVQRLVQVFLGLKDIPEPDDAADALAVAICCSGAIDRHI